MDTKWDYPVPTSLAEWLPISLVLILLNFFQKSTYMTHLGIKQIKFTTLLFIASPHQTQLEDLHVTGMVSVDLWLLFSPHYSLPTPTASDSTLILLFILNDFLLKSLVQNLHVTEDPSCYQALSLPFPNTPFQQTILCSWYPLVKY